MKKNTNKKMRKKQSKVVFSEKKYKNAKKKEKILKEKTKKHIVGLG